MAGQREEYVVEGGRAHGEPGQRAALRVEFVAEAEQVYRFGGNAEPFLVFNLAVLLEDLGREPEAIVAYREALALDPQFADAPFNLARLYERARDAKASLRHLLAYRRMMDQGA